MKLYICKKLNESLRNDLVDDSIFPDNAQSSLSRFELEEIIPYIKEASKLNARLQDLREHVDIINWWIDNGEDVSIQDLIDTLSYLEEVYN